LVRKGGGGKEKRRRVNKPHMWGGRIGEREESDEAVL